MAKKKFYAVAVGKKPGIYETWPECEKQTKGYSGARFKSFPTRAAAQDFINENSSTRRITTVRTTPSAAASEEASSLKRPAKRLRTNAHLQPSNAPFCGQVTINVHFDGGSRGNPGSAGAGAHVEIVSEGKGGSSRRQTVQVRKYLGNRATNNIAEYQGLICGLQEAKNVAMNFQSTKESDRIHLHVCGDSDLIIQQMKGTYQCKSKNLVELYQEAKALVAEMKQLAPVKVTFEHVYREENSVADALANEAMDTGRSWTTIEDDEGSSSDNEAKPKASERVGEDRYDDLLEV